MDNGGQVAMTEVRCYEGEAYTCPYRTRPACHLTAKPPTKRVEDTSDLEESAPGTQHTHAQVSPEALRHVCNLMGHSAEGTQKLKLKLGAEGTAVHKVCMTYLEADSAKLNSNLLTGKGRARAGDAAQMLKRLPTPVMANRAWSLTALVIIQTVIAGFAI